MSDTFQKTVNLKDRQLPDRNAQPPKPRQEQSSRAQEASEKKKNEAMDKIFGEEKNDIQKISRASSRRKSRVPGFIWLLIAIIIFAFSAYYLSRDKKEEPAKNQQEQPIVEQWYSIKLVNGEVYYGKIGDIKADPVVMRNVYYDYDLLNKKEGAAESEEKPAQTGLRLVKRGKESYGPDGTMNIVRAQIMFFEPLKEESKVLRAILENEGK